eukprot:CAMPEP_0196994172 /NCGR_PEP_ID=MMETSP1380-20130617/429_1 /TAXON_ID=5936 /ORGANISM="Euplotes crassus, Strain CT5" /LENGTH=290 /DNA_ID=CAMNT_0042409477 /DNA_START=38 /DNA_END=910 /DNA_ORIENTATION=+
MAWKSFAPGEGPFSHLSEDEFAARYLMPLENDALQTPPTFNANEFKSIFGTHGFSWRTHDTMSHCVGKIRNQGKCGSCWAHAIAEFLSDRYCIQSQGALNTTFAPQFMVDCAGLDYEAEGCDGAETQTMLSWVEKYGLVNETCYPYFSGDTQDKGTCHDTTCTDGSPSINHGVEDGSVKLFFNYTNVDLAHELMNNGPLYFSMVVFGDFKEYHGGVYHPIDYTMKGTHAIKCVGWGYDEPSASFYWECANSWTEEWGEDGFFRIGFNDFIGYKAGSARMGTSKVPHLFSS